MSYKYHFQCPAAGGTGGDPWDDSTSSPAEIVGIQSIQLYGGKYIDSIQVTYYLANGSVWQAPLRGGGGGDQTLIPLAQGETIYMITGQSGDVVDGITSISTVHPDGSTSTYGPFGGGGGDGYTLTGPVVSFYGRSGEYVDALGFYQYVNPGK